MTLALFTVLLLSCIGATSIVVRSNAESNGIQNSPFGMVQFAVIWSSPCMVLFGVGLLMFNSGISLAWILGTLTAACGAMAIGMWRVHVEGFYENKWGLLGFLSVPVWAIAGISTGLIRLFI